jgi:hypothetical protein
MGEQIMSSIKILEELRLVDSVCAQMAAEIQMIEDAAERGELSADERCHLLKEIRDIRVAREAAGNEVAARHIVNAVTLLLKII